MNATDVAARRGRDGDVQPADRARIRVVHRAEQRGEFRCREPSPSSTVPRRRRFAPNAPFAAGAVYTATVSGATTADGQKMPVPVSWSFTTTLPPGADLEDAGRRRDECAARLECHRRLRPPGRRGSTSFRLVDALDQTVPGSVTLNTDGTAAAFTPDDPARVGDDVHGHRVGRDVTRRRGHAHAGLVDLHDRVPTDGHLGHTRRGR